MSYNQDETAAMINWRQQQQQRSLSKQFFSRGFPLAATALHFCVPNDMRQIGTPDAALMRADDKNEPRQARA